MRGDPSHDFFCLLICRQSVWPLRTEKTADFGVESRDPTANLCPSSKIPDFLRVGGGRIEKRQFSRFLGWVFCRSATAYIEHQICTQKAWIISGDVVDVPFGVSNPPTNNGTPMGDHQTPKIFRSKNLFSVANPTQKNSLISTVPLFSKSNKKWQICRKNVISA